MTSATSVPILVFLGLSFLGLGPMYATDRQRSDAHHRLMPPFYADLQRKCASFAAAFPDAIDGDRLAEESNDCRIGLLVKRRAASDLTPHGSLSFIVSIGGNDVFPNLKVGLQILLTVSISAAGCERSFS